MDRSFWKTLPLAVLACASCDRADDQDSLLSQPVARTELQPTNIPALPSEALDALAAARCEREVSCSNVGPGRAYPSDVECRFRIRALWEGDLNRVACTRGVDEGALASCLREIRASSCNDLSDGLQRLVECRQDRICERAG